VKGTEGFGTGAVAVGGEVGEVVGFDDGEYVGIGFYLGYCFGCYVVFVRWGWGYVGWWR